MTTINPCDHCDAPTPSSDLVRCSACAAYLCDDCHAMSPRPCCGAKS